MSGPWDFACLVAWLVLTVTVGPVLWLDEWCTARLAAVRLRPCRWAGSSLGAWVCVPCDLGVLSSLDFGVTLGQLRPGSWGVRLGLGLTTLEVSADV